MSNGGTISRVNLRECLTLPEFGEQFMQNLVRFGNTDMAQAESIQAAAQTATEMTYGFSPQVEDTSRKQFIYSNGVAVIAVHGSLVNRLAYSWGYVTGYQSIRRQINAIRADKAANPDDVQLVVFDHDSCGGEAAGCFELGAEIAALGEVVPTLAIIDSLSCSGSYALAVACNKVIAIPSATVGSIGVYRLHADLSEMYGKTGIKFTYIKSGEHKTDGNPYEPLGPGVEADWQEKVNTQRQLFAEFVAEHTSLSVADVLATEAQVYRAPDALDINLISGVMTPSEAVSVYLAELADDELDPEANDGDDEMKVPGQEVASGSQVAPAASAPVIDQTAISNAVAAGIASHMTAMRQRGAAVRAHASYEANTALANHLLDNTEMSADEINATIAVATPAKPDEQQAAPKFDANTGKPLVSSTPAPKFDVNTGKPLVSTVDTTDHLAAAMNGIKTPNVGSGSEGGEQQSGERTDADHTNDLVASYQKATGRKLKVVGE